MKIAALVFGAFLALLGVGTGMLSIPMRPYTGMLMLIGAIVVAIGIGVVIVAGMSGPPACERAPGPNPVAVDATLDEPLSRWKWLVKWILALPHLAILAFLSVAFVILTVAAFVTILVVGRYPQPIFATNVGILRWGWRVGYFAFSVLGTDRYPPFSLADADYPARLRVTYPEHLSRGLALVKSWLLALPHYLIIGAFTNTTWASHQSGNDGGGPQSNLGLAPLLVLIAAVALLFTRRYPRGIFDLVTGVHRWVYRVITYVSFMHDSYPPFRLDLGGADPASGRAPLVEGL